MGDLLIMDGVTKLDIPPERVLEAAKEANLKTVVVMGITEDNSEYFASSTGDSLPILFLAERLKYEIVSGNWAEDGEEE